MFAITRTRSPLADLQGLIRLVDEAFRNWPGFSQEETPLVGNWLPPVDILVDKDAVRIPAELPGVKPEDVKISMEASLTGTTSRDPFRMHAWEPWSSTTGGIRATPTRSKGPA